MAGRREISGQKIRESCNSCSSQKIRCGKERPKCHRCTTKGLECNYSFSQRTGRRTASNAASSSSLPAPSTPTSIGGTFFGDAFGSLGNERNGLGATASLINAEDALLFDTSSTSIKDSDLFQGFSNNALGLPMDFLWSPPNETPSLSAGDVNSGVASQPLFDATSGGFNGGDGQSLVEGGSAPLASPRMPQEQATKQIQEPSQYSHDCMGRALRIASDLHMARSTCVTAGNEVASLKSPSIVGQGGRDIDAVLFQNKDAAQTIGKILDCRCAADPSVTLACHLAMTKIVEWYAAAIGIDSDPKDAQGIQAQGLNGVKIVARPIFMGRYCLDAEAQRAVRAQIVLSEMREHIQPLLMRLPRHAVGAERSEVSSAGSGSSSSSSKETEGQVCALREQIRRIVKEASAINQRPQ